MAAPVANKIILPLDTGNTGKNKRTQTRVVGADTVHEDFVIVQDMRSVLGCYKASSGSLTPPTTAHNGTTTGFAWLYNPVGSTIKMQISRMVYDMKFNALAVDLIPGELRADRFTFTGTGSGTLVTPAKRDSNDAASQGNFRLASTGLTCTPVATLFGAQFPTMDLVTGGAGQWNPHRVVYEQPSQDEEFILRAGEGIVYWSQQNLTTANRRLFINVAWDEFE